MRILRPQQGEPARVFFNRAATFLSALLVKLQVIYSSIVGRSVDHFNLISDI